jgi:septal ring factor EnvC (AmiA/AmiB activator)
VSPQHACGGTLPACRAEGHYLKERFDMVTHAHFDSKTVRAFVLGLIVGCLLTLGVAWPISLTILIQRQTAELEKETASAEERRQESEKEFEKMKKETAKEFEKAKQKIEKTEQEIEKTKKEIEKTMHENEQLKQQLEQRRKKASP